MINQYQYLEKGVKFNMIWKAANDRYNNNLDINASLIQIIITLFKSIFQATHQSNKEASRCPWYQKPVHQKGILYDG